MTFLLETKEKLRKVYIRFSDWLLLVLKFTLAMVVFEAINMNIGFLPVFNNMFIVLIMALLCALLPTKMITLFSAIMIVGHSYALGIEIAGVVLCLILLLFIFVIRFASKDVISMLLTPFAIGFGIPCAVPVCCGLKSKPSSALSVCCGTFVYYLLGIIKEKASVLKGLEEVDMLANARLILDGVAKNKMMLLHMAVLTLIVIIVYIISRIAVDHIWTVAIFLGSGAYLALMIAGGIFLEIEINMISLVIGVVISVLISMILSFFVLSVDYTRTERLEYEDDEYYYYVKAVPKMTIAKPKKKITTIKAEDGDNLLGNNREEASYDESDLARKLEESLKEL